MEEEEEKEEEEEEAECTHRTAWPCTTRTVSGWKCPSATRTSTGLLLPCVVERGGVLGLWVGVGGGRGAEVGSRLLRPMVWVLGVVTGG